MQDSKMREKQSQNHRTASSRKQEEASFLAHCDIFGHLNSAEVSALERIMTVITCPPGRIFYRPGDQGSTLFLLNTGRVQLYHLSTDGRKLVTATLGAGTYFGEQPLLGQRVYTSFAEAIEPSQVGVMTSHDVENLLTQKPEIALALLRVMGQRLVQLEAQLIDTTFKGTPARLATLLLQLAHQQGNTLVVEGLSHEELAERLGVYRETVSTALRELKDMGAIALGRKHITISEPARLQEIAASLGIRNTNA